MCNHSIKYIDEVLQKTLININQEKSCSLTLITNHFWSATSVITWPLSLPQAEMEVSAPYWNQTD